MDFNILVATVCMLIFFFNIILLTIRHAERENDKKRKHELEMAKLASKK